MNYWRCKCGAYTAWESGFPPARCTGCEKCNTTLARHPDDHQEPEPHVMELRYDERTGEATHYTCVVCMKKFPLDQAV